MLRQSRFFILALFLVAVTSNFIQATHISVSRTPLPAQLLTITPNTGQTDDLAFIVSDDDTDDTPTLILSQTTIENVKSTFLSLRLNVSAWKMTPLDERPTVLKL